MNIVIEKNEDPDNLEGFSQDHYCSINKEEANSKEEKIKPKLTRLHTVTILLKEEYSTETEAYSHHELETIISPVDIGAGLSVESITIESITIDSKAKTKVDWIPKA